MSISGLNNLRQDWRLGNSLTIGGDLVVDGDTSSTGFVYNDGIPVVPITGNANVWTNTNEYTQVPTFIAPIANEDMATVDYSATQAETAGSAYQSTTNTWSGVNTMDNLPELPNVGVSNPTLMNQTTADSQLGNIQINPANPSGTSFTKQQTFTAEATVTTASITTNNNFVNKKYVDDLLATFNSGGGIVEIQEFLTTATIPCDTTTYSSWLVAVVSGGGYGQSTVTTSLNGTYGGSGGFAVMTIPAFNGTATFTKMSYAYRQSQDAFFKTTPTGGSPLTYFTVVGGANGDDNGGAGGIVTSIPSGLSGIQQVTGGQGGIIPAPVPAGVIYTPNPAVWNGFGMGGSTIAGVDVLPTGCYCLIVKFKNTSN